MLPKQTICGIDVTNAGKQDILEYIFKKLRVPSFAKASAGKKSEKLKVYTPNPEIIVYATKHPEYKTILNNADIALPDGVGVMLGGKILNKPLKERITGTDFINLICKESAGKPIRLGLLGGEPGVAEKAAECLRSNYPGIKIVFASSEWPEEKRIKIQSFDLTQDRDSGFKNENTRFINHESSIMNPLIDILFVAYGAPKQEEWISKNLDRLPVRVAMGVGGAFDYISGNISRAPEFVRRLGLEWLYRLFRQPWRWRRQVALIKFAVLLLREKFLNKSL